MAKKVNILPTDKLIFDLEMLQIDYNEQKKKALRQEIADKYNVPLRNVEINFIPVTVNKDGEKVALTAEIINNIQDPKFQQELFPEYLKIKGIEDVNMDEIIAIDNQVNSFVDFNSYTKNKTYKFKYVKWDNYLSYGKGNYFDFTKLKGLVLLNGYPENQSGKTTFAIDLLRFALFGKADKSPTLDSVFNIFLPKETEVMVEACIEINGEDYVIRRTVTRPALNKRTEKSKAKQKVEYFKLINGSYELIENCEAETVAQTNNIIRETVGTVEDFNLVISATAYTLGDLLRMGQTDKSKLFSRWLGLVSLEEKDKIAKEYYKNKVANTLLSNKYNKTLLEHEIVDYKTVIDDNTKEVKNIEKRKEETTKNIDTFNNEKMLLLGQKRPIKENISVNVRSIENQIRMNNEELALKRSQMTVLKEEYAKIKNAEFDEELYKSKKDVVTMLQTRNGEIKGIIGTNKNEIKRINDLMLNKTCPTCGHQIDTVEQNSFIADIEAKIQTFTDEGIKNKKKIDDLQVEISALEQKKTDTERVKTLQLKMVAIKTNIDNIKLKLADLGRQKDEYEQNKENIAFNGEVDTKVNIVDEKIKTETRLKEQYIKDIEKLKNENITFENEIKKRGDIIKEIEKEEVIIRNWTIYQQLVGKNGIIKLVLKRALPVINNEIRRLLNDLCDFDVILSISDDNKVCLDLYRDGQKLDLGTCASGFESCISSLALRCALANIASFSKPNVLVVDEVLSGVSADNMENIMTLYKRVLTNYDFILHICHDTSLVDYHDQIVTVTKKDNVSVITF